MKRRSIFQIAATVLLLRNVAYFWWRLETREHEMVAIWVAYMPDLEASQRRDPTNFLNSSHSHDPRYPVTNDFENGHLLMRTAYLCKVQESYISEYVSLTGDPVVGPTQMPDRLYLPELSASQQNCMKSHLPMGYQLAQLQAPTLPKSIGWGENDLKLSLLSRPETNRLSHAQTH
ncbi:MAG: hypothetical protein V4521_12225 [Pseudomonadota bacterium]